MRTISLLTMTALVVFATAQQVAAQTSIPTVTAIVQDFEAIGTTASCALQLDGRSLVF
jgi:hypothetical protein